MRGEGISSPKVVQRSHKNELVLKLGIPIGLIPWGVRGGRLGLNYNGILPKKTEFGILV